VAQQPKKFVKIVIWLVVATMVLTFMAALLPALS
jgi:hypothetical protein